MWHVRGKQGENKQACPTFSVGNRADCLLKITKNYELVLSQATQCYQLPTSENQVAVNYLFSPQLRHKCRVVVPYFLPVLTYFARLPSAESQVAFTYFFSTQLPHICRVGVPYSLTFLTRIATYFQGRVTSPYRQNLFLFFFCMASLKPQQRCNTFCQVRIIQHL